MSMEENHHDASGADSEQRGKLVRQMIYAASAVGVLLALLVFFNHLATQEEPEDSPTYPAPVPVPPQRPQIRPVTPPETLPSTTTPDAEETLPGTPEQPDVTSGVVDAPPLGGSETPPAPPPTQATNRPAPQQVSPPQSARIARPATTDSPATITATTPAASKAPPEDVPELTAPPSITPPPDDPPPVTPPPSVAPRVATGFMVQAGVFVNTRRAEELHARLLQNGIPATLETRVQVGPFKTQAEAQAARAKMKALGIEGVVLPPR
jgi:DedD protein